jgi:hypothetical protein
MNAQTGMLSSKDGAKSAAATAYFRPAIIVET